MKSIFLIIALLIGTTLAGTPWIPEPQTQQDWMPWNWMERHQSFVDNSAVNGGNISVLFFGDSITDAWDETGRSIWDSVFAPLGAADYGIGGDRTEHTLWRIINGEVENLSPKICVLKIGTNNVGSNSEEEISRGVAAIVTELRSRLPRMKVLLLGVLPRHNAELTDLVERINTAVSIMDNGNMVRFLNMRDAYYAGNGQFYTDLFTDDLWHLSEAGYSKWNETMSAQFLEMYNLGHWGMNNTCEKK